MDTCAGDHSALVMGAQPWEWRCGSSYLVWFQPESGAKAWWAFSALGSVKAGSCLWKAQLCETKPWRAGRDMHLVGAGTHPSIPEHLSLIHI